MAGQKNAGETHFPERIGRYDVLLPIASGGMGTVYLARARGVGGFEREVALKLMHGHLKQESSFSHDLIEEAKLAVRIRHPNVVSVIDVGDDPFGIFLVMDYVEGDTLAGLLKRAGAAEERLPVRIGLHILMDALSGLHAAHELKDEMGGSLELVHRDFSPQNILVGTDGVARLTDFGIAKAATRIGNTSTGIVKGKITYMAPEQARGDPIDRRCDVWAAGVVAWQIVAGRRLYTIENDVSTLLKIVTSTPPRLKDIVPDVAPAIDEAVAKALILDRNHRCASASAFRQSLVAACRASNLLAEPEEVAAWVSRLVGLKLGERRERVAEVGALRARMGKLASPEGEISTPSAEALPSSSPPGPTQEMTAIEVSFNDVEVPAPSSAPPTKLQPAVPSVDATRTDATSVTTGNASRLGRPRRLTPRRLWIFGAGATGALVVSLAVARGFRGGSPSVTASPSSAPADPPVASAPPPADSQAPSSHPPPLELPSTTLIDHSLGVHANGVVASLRIDGHIVDVGRAARDVVASLTDDEVARVLTFDATCVDGRRATGTIPVGASTIRITFPAPRAPRAPVATPPPARPGEAPPALAPIPYGRPHT